MDPQATAGRIVHYTDATGRAIAAIVCVDAAPNGTAALNTLFLGKPSVSMREVPYSERPAPGCWSWMPYQKAKAELPDGNVSESAEPRPSVPRPIAGTLDNVAAHLNDLNERVEALEVAAEKEAFAAAAADPSTAEVPGPSPMGAEREKMTEPPNVDAEPDQVGDEAETVVTIESGPARGADEAQDSDEVPGPAPG